MSFERWIPSFSAASTCVRDSFSAAMIWPRIVGSPLQKQTAPLFGAGSFLLRGLCPQILSLKVAGVDNISADFEHHRTDGGVKLTHVARPGVPLHFSDRRDPKQLLLVLGEHRAVVFVLEVSGQRFDIFGPLPKWRDKMSAFPIDNRDPQESACPPPSRECRVLRLRLRETPPGSAAPSSHLSFGTSAPEVRAETSADWSSRACGLHRETGCFVGLQQEAGLVVICTRERSLDVAKEVRLKGALARIQFGARDLDYPEVVRQARARFPCPFRFRRQCARRRGAGAASVI